MKQVQCLRNLKNDIEMYRIIETNVNKSSVEECLVLLHVATCCY